MGGSSWIPGLRGGLVEAGRHRPLASRAWGTDPALRRMAVERRTKRAAWFGWPGVWPLGPVPGFRPGSCAALLRLLGLPRRSLSPRPGFRWCSAPGTEVWLSPVLCRVLRVSCCGCPSFGGLPWFPLGYFPPGWSSLVSVRVLSGKKKQKRTRRAEQNSSVYIKLQTG